MIQSCIALCCLEQLLSSHKGHPRICHITYFLVLSDLQQVLPERDGDGFGTVGGAEL